MLGCDVGSRRGRVVERGDARGCAFRRGHVTSLILERARRAGGRGYMWGRNGGSGVIWIGNGGAGRSWNGGCGA